MYRKRLHLHGYLAKLLPNPVVEIEANTVADAINGLCRVTGRALSPNPKMGPHQVRVLGFETAESLATPTEVEDIHIVPAFTGGKSGLVTILLGVVIIGVALIASGGALLTAAGALTGWGQLALAGALMMVGGLLQLVSPAPGSNAQSRYLGATENTVKIGTPIPYLIGRYVLAGQYISFNVVTQQLFTNDLTLQATYEVVDP